MIDEEHSLSIVVQGEAVPKQSFRYSKRGSYQDPRVTAWEQVVRLAGMAARPRPTPAEMAGQWCVVLTFYRKSRRAVDVDNLSKAVLDALSGVLWYDDKQVVDLHIGKVQVEDPMVKIEAWPALPACEHLWRNHD